MKPEQVVQFLALLGADPPHYQPRGGWTLSHCPFGPWKHDDGKSSQSVFGVKHDEGDNFSNCFACGWHGRLSDIVLEMALLNKKIFARKYEFMVCQQMLDEAEAGQEFNFDHPDEEELMALKAKKNQLYEFPEWWLDTFLPYDQSPLALKFLEQRGVPDEVAHDFDIRFDTQQRRVCFPVRDFKGVLRGLHGRAIDPGNDLRYRMYVQSGQKNPIIWLNEHRIDRSKPIVVVEGPFDVTSVYRVYRNVTSPLFVSPNVDKLKRMADAYEWFSLYDRGAGGDAGRLRLDKVLGKDHVIVHLHPPKGRKDPGECSVDELTALIGGHLPLDPVLK